MICRSGKKMRAPSSRVSKTDENQHIQIIRKMLDYKMFADDGRVSAAVMDYYLYRVCTNYSRYKLPESGLTIKTKGTKVTKHTLDGVMKSVRGMSFVGDTISLPQRWNDTSPKLKRRMYLGALLASDIPHRSITFWVGSKLIAQSKAKGKPLAAWLLKRISQRLKTILGDIEFGIWFHLETKPSEPDKIHAHGIIYVADPVWLRSRTLEYKDLRESIRIATGYEPMIGGTPIRKERWVHISDKPLNFGIIDYAEKSRRNRLFTAQFIGEPSEQIGNRIEATSQTLIKRGRSFYEHTRPFVRAIITNQLADWSTDEYEKAGACMAPFWGPKLNLRFPPTPSR